MIGRGGRRLGDIAAWLATLTRFRFPQMPRRDLQREARGRQEPGATRHGVERAEVQVLAPFVRFAAVERGRFDLPPRAVDARGDHAERHVRGIEPVMRDWRDRVRHRRDPMRIGDRSERRLGRRSAEQLPPRAAPERAVVFAESSIAKSC